MPDRHGNELERSYAQGARGGFKLYPGLAPAFLRIAEDIAEALPRLGEGLGIAVHGENAALREGPHVVEPGYVIGVGMREEQGVEARYASSQRLEAELWPRVYDDRRGRRPCAALGVGASGFDEDRCSVSPISGIGRSADMAIAADFGYAEAGS
jgi:hypothetical protein